MQGGHRTMGPRSSAMGSRSPAHLFQQERELAVGALAQGAGATDAGVRPAGLRSSAGNAHGEIPAKAEHLIVPATIYVSELERRPGGELTFQ